MRADPTSRPLGPWIALLAAPACAFVAVSLPNLRPRNGYIVLGTLAGLAFLGAVLAIARQRAWVADHVRGLLLMGCFAAAPIAFGKYLTEKSDVFVTTLGIAVWAPDFLLVGSAAICLLFFTLPERRALRWTLGAFSPLIAFVVVQALVAPFSKSPTLGFYEVVRYLVALALSVVLVRILERRDLPYVVAGLLVSAVVQSVFAAGQYYRGWTFGQEIFGQSAGVLVGTFGDASTVRVTGLMGFPNALGTFLVMVLPIAVALAVTPQRLLVRLAGLGVLAAGIPALIFTFSRGAWLCFAAATVLVLLYELHRRPARDQLLLASIGAFALLVVGVVVYIFYGDQIAARIKYSPAESLEIRSQLNWAALRVLRENPIFGVGPNVFPLELLGSNESDAVAPAHDLYLLVLAEAGIVGFVLFAAQILRCLRPPRWPIEGRGIEEIDAIRIGLWAGFIAFLLHQVVDITYAMPAVFRVVWLVATLLLFLQRPPERATP
jgi:hypothetical protein